MHHQNNFSVPQCGGGMYHSAHFGKHIHNSVCEWQMDKRMNKCLFILSPICPCDAESHWGLTILPWFLLWRWVIMCSLVAEQNKVTEGAPRALCRSRGKLKTATPLCQHLAKVNGRILFERIHSDFRSILPALELFMFCFDTPQQSISQLAFQVTSLVNWMCGISSQFKSSCSVKASEVC